MGVVRPADLRREPRLIRSLAPALVSGGNLGLGDLAASAPLYRACSGRGGGPRPLCRAVFGALGQFGHLKRGQLPADTARSTPGASREGAGERRDRVFGTHTRRTAATGTQTADTNMQVTGGIAFSAPTPPARPRVVSQSQRYRTRGPTQRDSSRTRRSQARSNS